MMQQNHTPADEPLTPPVQDKRRHPRVPVPHPTQVYCENSGCVLGEIANLSLGGLMFRAESWIEPGTLLRAEFKLSNRTVPVVCSLQASVAWCEAGRAPNCYWVGCRNVYVPFFTRAWLKQIFSR